MAEGNTRSLQAQGFTKRSSSRRRCSPLLDSGKTPVLARSAVTVDPILSASIQVLLAEGQERLTTTRVAYRAGVSVGTLYQYFPKQAGLLIKALEVSAQFQCGN